MVMDWSCVLEIYEGLYNIIDSNAALARSYKLMSKGAPKIHGRRTDCHHGFRLQMVNHTLLLAVEAVEATKMLPNDIKTT